MGRRHKNDYVLDITMPFDGSRQQQELDADYYEGLLPGIKRRAVGALVLSGASAALAGASFATEGHQASWLAATAGVCAIGGTLLWGNNIDPLAEYTQTLDVHRSLEASAPSLVSDPRYVVPPVDYFNSK